MLGDRAILSFHTVDYAVFCSVLIFSIAVGTLFSFKGNKNATDFLSIGKEMSLLPVALSTSASMLSAISYLGVVGEVYGHGIQQMWFLIGFGISTVIVGQAIIPLMYSLNLKCITQFIEMRFQSTLLRKVISLISILDMITYLGFCLYAPTLALDAVTPLSYHVTIPLLGLIVTLYSAMGGLRAVIWTDVFQWIVMIGGLLVFTVYSIVQLGGPSSMWQIASQHNRTGTLDFRFGWHVRHTITNTVLMGITRTVFGSGFTQLIIQRINTLPTVTHAQLLSYMSNSMTILLLATLYLCGLGIFALYAGCDPISTGIVNKKDQLLPLFVVQYLGYYIGVPGLFVACLFSAALSSLSSALSHTTALIWLDFLSEISFFQKSSERLKLFANKVIVLVLGLTAVGVAFLAKSISGLMEANITVQSAMSGPIFGMYLLAILVPACSKRGAIAGLVISFIIMIWLTTGSKYYGLKSDMLPLSTENCNATFDSVSGVQTYQNIEYSYIQSNETVESESDELPHPLYGISYTYINTLGTVLCFVIGCVVTIPSGNRSEAVDPRLVLPCVRRFAQKREVDDGQVQVSKNVIANTRL